jgi:hypothetical protein
MHFSSLSALRPITKIHLFLLLTPCILHAMEKQRSSYTHNEQLTFSNAFGIKAIVTFHARNGDQKDFARYISPRSLDHDDEGNVHELDTLNVSIKTNKFPPMFNIILTPIAVNIVQRKMKVSCETFNQYDPSQSVTIEMIIPLDKDHAVEIPLGLRDETGQLVSLSIEATTQY